MTVKKSIGTVLGLTLLLTACAGTKAQQPAKVVNVELSNPQKSEVLSERVEKHADPDDIEAYIDTSEKPQVKLEDALDSTVQTMISDFTGQDDPNPVGTSITMGILGLAALHPPKKVVFLPFKNYSKYEGLSEKFELYTLNALKRVGQFNVQSSQSVKKIISKKGIFFPKTANYDDVALFGYEMGCSFVCVGSILKVEKLETQKKTFFSTTTLYSVKVAGKISFIDTVSGDVVYSYSDSIITPSENTEKGLEKGIKKALRLLSSKVPGPLYVKTQNIEWVGKVLLVNAETKTVVIEAQEGMGMDSGTVVEVYKKREGVLDFATGHYSMPEANKVGELEVVSFSGKKAVTEIKNGGGFKTGFLVLLKEKH